MPSSIQAAVNVRIGSTSYVAPPSYADVGNSVIAVLIYNNTSGILTVTGEFGQRFLQPNTADIFPCQGIIAQPSVTTATIGPNGTFVGTIQGVFYFQGDLIPQNYPLALVPFAGGSTLIITSIGNVLPSLPITILPPAGTGNLIFNSQTAITGISITGVQTGRTYATGINIAANSSISIPLINAADTSYSINVGTGVLDSIAAGPALSTPLGAILSASASATSDIIAAPSSGAYYLMGADLVNSGATECAVQIEAPKGTAIAFLATTAAEGAGGIDHVNLSMFRNTGITTVTFLVAGTSPTCLLRYTPGP